MLIAIDFDDTLTADSKLWGDFIASASTLGHRCYCVTARRQTEENIEEIDNWMNQHGISLPVFFTGLRSKIEYMNSIGIKVDIWIDDNPIALVRGH